MPSPDIAPAVGLTLYYGSGSPYAWRVQLALEQKALAYELRILSFADRDTRKPEFLALNPRHRVPVIVDDGFVLYESNAIVEYLDEAYPGRGAPLFPGNVQQRSIIRRLIMEIDNDFDAALDPLLAQAFRVKADARDTQAVSTARQAVTDELVLFSDGMRGEFLAGPLSAADFALYPLVALLDRVSMKIPEIEPDAMLTPALHAWMARVEALPFLARTIPPHWKKA